MAFAQCVECGEKLFIFAAQDDDIMDGFLCETCYREIEA